MKKFYIYLSLIILLSLAIFYYFQTKENNLKAESPEKIVIATCPTYYQVLDDLDKNVYEIIKTQSTSESLTLLSENKVDIVMAGRILRPEEPDFEKEILGNGYSFLSDKEQTILTEDLKKALIFTDINVNELNNYFLLENVEKVNDVYEYINKGIVITTWDNTDLNRAEFVHVYNADGTRNINSRIPTLYYKDIIDLTVINSLKRGLSQYVKQY